MIRMAKAIFLNTKGETIKWYYHQCPKRRRIFFDEINGEKFKRTAADQKRANQIIDRMIYRMYIKLRNN